MNITQVKGTFRLNLTIHEGSRNSGSCCFSSDSSLKGNLEGEFVFESDLLGSELAFELRRRGREFLATFGDESFF